MGRTFGELQKSCMHLSNIYNYLGPLMTFSNKAPKKVDDFPDFDVYTEQISGLFCFTAQQEVP